MDRSKIILFSIGGVTLVAFIVFGVLGFQTNNEAAAAIEARDSAVRSIEKIYKHGDPFPSKENVAKVRACAERISRVRSELTNALAARNVPAPRLTPSVFVQSLRKLANTKIENAPIVDGKKIVSPDFTFGFERYIGANPTMPREEDVPRLLQQLYVVDSLVDSLFEAQVSRVDTIGRELFDTAETPEDGLGGANSHRGGRRFAKKAPKAKKGESERRSQHFSVKFAARQDAAIAFVNSLSKMKFFVLITDISFRKVGSDIRVPGRPGEDELGEGSGGRRSSRRRRQQREEDEALAGEAAVPTISKLPPAQRLMAGSEIDPPIEVTVEFDVYAFAKGGK